MRITSSKYDQHKDLVGKAAWFWKSQGTYFADKRSEKIKKITAKKHRSLNYERGPRMTAEQHAAV